ncbi:hypothetical protein VTN02DRAFT_6884 [Thermoascus thermophilus]
MFSSSNPSAKTPMTAVGREAGDIVDIVDIITNPTRRRAEDSGHGVGARAAKPFGAERARFAEGGQRHTPSRRRCAVSPAY